VYPEPRAAFSTNPTTETILTPVYNYINQSTGFVSLLWNFSDFAGDTSTALNPNHTYPADTGRYCALLTVTNAEGCIDTSRSCNDIGPLFEFYIPNTFTPNGDLKNETFSGKGIGIIQYEMSIFDRWGKKIFTTQNLEIGWDGKANNGSEGAQQDIYVYTIVLTDVFNKLHNYVGSVALLR
jgi:gliding motility-associated-like protein